MSDLPAILAHFNERRCSSFDEFHSIVSQLSEDGGKWIFRGQGVRALPLPRFFRDEPPKARLSEYEHEMVASIRSRAPRVFSESNESDWRALTWLQHYGAATRLLDWSSDPLVALWFAIKNRLKNAADFPGTVGFEASVWALSSTQIRWLKEREFAEISPFAIDEVTIVEPPLNDVRVIAQRSVFTVHKVPRGTGDCVLGEPAWIQQLRRGGMTMLTISDDNLSAFEDSLLLAGIDERAIYPEMSDIAVAAKDEGQRYLSRPALRSVQITTGIGWSAGKQ